jgi:hypothetical protein
LGSAGASPSQKAFSEHTHWAFKIASAFCQSEWGAQFDTAPTHFVSTAADIVAVDSRSAGFGVGFLVKHEDEGLSGCSFLLEWLSATTETATTL